METVRKINNDSAYISFNISRVFQQVVQGSSELAATQTRQWDVSRGLAVQLQNSLKSMKSNEISALMGTFGDIHDQLVMCFVSFSHDQRLKYSSKPLTIS